MLRFLTAGESHGQALVVIVEGLPAGLHVTVEDISGELARRRLGYGRGPRMRFVQDEIRLLAGVRHGRTLGSPVAIEIGNSEWPKWVEEMSPAPGATQKPLTQQRPGHADLAGMQSTGSTTHACSSGPQRETAALVGRWRFAKRRRRARRRVLSHIVQIGPAARRRPSGRGPATSSASTSPAVRASIPAAEAMVAETKCGEGRRLAGWRGRGARLWRPRGLGSHVHWDRKLDSLLAQAIMSIQAVKGVVIGDGFEVAGRRGSVAHDPISWDADNGAYRRESTQAGGIEGGMSTGEVIVVRSYMKPLATLNRPVLKTVDVVTKEETVSFKERTDVTAVPAMGVVAETMVALVLANEALRKFGGDSMPEVVRNRDGYVANL